MKTTITVQQFVAATCWHREREGEEEKAVLGFLFAHDLHDFSSQLSHHPS